MRRAIILSVRRMNNKRKPTVARERKGKDTFESGIPRRGTRLIEKKSNREFSGRERLALGWALECVMPLIPRGRLKFNIAAGNELYMWEYEYK